MKLTPEQKAEGWIEWNGGGRPIKDSRTVAVVKYDHGGEMVDAKWDQDEFWSDEVVAYRIIEAHGADAEPASPTPWPASYDELVWDADGWSQTIIVDGKRPEWLRGDDWCRTKDTNGYDYRAVGICDQFAIRVRRREPKRETVECFLIVTARTPSLEFQATIDLIDGKPDLSTLKIAEDAL